VGEREERAETAVWRPILAADVAGYSRLMGGDEEGTLERLKEHRRELVDPKLAEHHGRNRQDDRRRTPRRVRQASSTRLRCAGRGAAAGMGRTAIAGGTGRSAHSRFRVGNQSRRTSSSMRATSSGDGGQRRPPASKRWAEPGGNPASAGVRGATRIRDKLDVAFAEHGRATGQEHRQAGGAPTASCSARDHRRPEPPSAPGGTRASTLRQAVDRGPAVPET